MYRILIVTSICLLLALKVMGGCSYQEQKDTIQNQELNRNYFLAFPVLFYGEETSWGGGVSGGYYFTKEGKGKASNIQGNLIYTLKNQASISILPKFYTENRDFYYSGHIKADYYPDKFFGIGRNAHDSLEENYISKDVSLLFQRQRVLFDAIMVGFQGQWSYYKIDDFEEGGQLINKTITGTKPFFTSGLGLLATWDTRDNFFYPTEGEFYKASLMINSKIFGSKLEFSKLTIDLRNYYPIIGRHLFSLQVFGDFAWGDVPFQYLPAMGGNDVLRGYYKGRYRDNNLLAAQLEYRFPIYKWFKGSMFGSAGDVSREIDEISLKELKISYGFGFRARVNPANVHLRFDVGFTPDNKPAFYFTANEAF